MARSPAAARRQHVQVRASLGSAARLGLQPVHAPPRQALPAVLPGPEGPGLHPWSPMSVAVMLLIAGAVLAWPSAHSASPVASGRLAAGEDHVSSGTNAGAAVIRTVVPVVEVAGVIDLLALTLRGGV